MTMERWQEAFQVTIDAYYEGDLERGLAACEAILARSELPAEIRLQTRRNLVFYAPPLSELLSLVETWPVRIPATRGLRLLNASIASGDFDLSLLVCGTPADGLETRQDTGREVAAGKDLSSYLLHLAPDLDVHEIRSIRGRGDHLDGPRLMGTGCESARLFRHAAAWWICAPTGNATAEEDEGVALFRLDGDALRYRQRLHADTGAHHRHWMPAPDQADASLRFVTSISPVQVVHHQGAGGLTPLKTDPGSPLLRWYRGASQFVPIEQGWLGLVSEVVEFERGGCTNLHRFIWFDANWRLARVSPPWIFQARGPEVAAGIARWGRELLISYRVDEQDAWLAIAPLSDVMRLLTDPLDKEGVERRLHLEVATVVPTEASPVSTHPSVPPADAEQQSLSGHREPAGNGDLGEPCLFSSPAKSPGNESGDEIAHDVPMLSRYTQEHPNDPSGFSRLAEALTAAGRLDEAIAAFRICASLADEDEMGAWAMYRAAECFLDVQRPADAVEALAHGMARHAGLGELLWLAAVASWQAHRPAQAACWARRAITLGRFAGVVDAVSRDNSRNPAALWEGPFDILRFALRRLGDDAGADEAERLFHEARSAREAKTKRSMVATDTH